MVGSEYDSLVCPDGCQELIDQVFSDCKEDDIYKSSNKWQGFMMYAEGALRSGCGLGYEANDCDKALLAYTYNGKYMGEALCSPDNNVEECSTECTSLVTAVKDNCGGKSWVPIAGFLSQTNTEILFDATKNLFKLNYQSMLYAYEICDAKFLVAPEEEEEEEEVVDDGEGGKKDDLVGSAASVRKVSINIFVMVIVVCATVCSFQ